MGELAATVAERGEAVVDEASVFLGFVSQALENCVELTTVGFNVIMAIFVFHGVMGV